MNKRELADGVGLILGQNGQDRAVQPQTIMWCADRVFGELLALHIKRYGQQARGDFSLTKMFPVQKNEERGLKYISLLINGTIFSNDIVLISKTMDMEGGIPLATTGQQSIYSGLEAALPRQAWKEGDSIYFKGLPWDASELAVTGIPSISALDFEDAIPLPIEMENNLVVGVIKLLSSLPQEDKTNDSRQSIT